MEIRLHKFLADAGVASRRKSEDLIAEGRVSVDGEPVTVMGVRIDPDVSEVRLDGQVVLLGPRVYYALHKPRGFLCTSDESKAPHRAIDLIPQAPTRVYTAGRLDADSEGLILVTNDGVFASRLTHPRYEVGKVYRVKVLEKVSDRTLRTIAKGVRLREGMVRPRRVENIGGGRNWTEVEIEVTEGLNREVRRIFEKVGHPVDRLVRLSVGPFFLGDLRPGRWKRIPETRIRDFLASIKTP